MAQKEALGGPKVVDSTIKVAQFDSGRLRVAQDGRLKAP